MEIVLMQFHQIQDLKNQTDSIFSIIVFLLIGIAMVVVHLETENPLAISLEYMTVLLEVGKKWTNKQTISYMNLDII